MTTSITLRRADERDLPAVVEVCGRALKWADGDLNADFFLWKHTANPFGPSPIWLAEVDGAEGSRIVGVRAMMRWELTRSGHPVARMTRAVDTATLPEFQGQGIFSRLTSAAVAELSAEGCTAVFNTPNDQSRPGYLKLGWSTLGRVPVTVRPRSPRSLATMLSSKVPAEKWGEPCSVGLDPVEALADPGPVEEVLAAAAPPARWSTPLSLEYLRWRTGFEPLGCRLFPAGTSPADGFVVFRVRRRGPLVQLSILHVVGLRGRAAGRVVGRLLRATGADVALASGSSMGWGAGLVALPRSGPIMTWKPLADPWSPRLADLDLSLGTVELF